MQNVTRTVLTYQAVAAVPASNGKAAIAAKPQRQVEAVTLFVPKGEEPQYGLLKLFVDDGHEQVFSIQESTPKNAPVVSPDVDLEV